jgi:hypothetical protein
MASTEARLRRRARRAYEVGRLSRAVRGAWPAVPLTAVATLTCGADARTTGLAGLTLAAVLVGLRFRGGAWERGVFPGLVAGLVPLAMTLAAPTIAVLLGDACAATCRVLTGACVAGGVGAGLLLSFVTRAGRSLAAALIVAGLTGALGCAVFGVAGILGVAGGLLAAVAIGAPRR